MSDLRGSVPPRAEWVPGWCGLVRGTSCTRIRRWPGRSWRRSTRLVKSRLVVNETIAGRLWIKCGATRPFRTMVSVHLDAVLLPVGVVGFARIPVGVGDGGVVLPPAQRGERLLFPGLDVFA